MTPSLADAARRIAQWYAATANHPKPEVHEMFEDLRAALDAPSQPKPPDLIRGATETQREVNRDFAATRLEEWRGKLAEQCGQTLAAQRSLTLAAEESTFYRNRLSRAEAVIAAAESLLPPMAHWEPKYREIIDALAAYRRDKPGDSDTRREFNRD